MGFIYRIPIIIDDHHCCCFDMTDQFIGKLPFMVVSDHIRGTTCQRKPQKLSSKHQIGVPQEEMLVALDENVQGANLDVLQRIILNIDYAQNTIQLVQLQP